MLAIQRSALLSTIALLASAPLPAQEPVERVQGSGVERTVVCAESPRVEVTGDGNVVRLVGDCRKVKLSGLRHVILAEGIERIEMSGANHRIEWQRAPGGQPKVDDNGLGNRVVRVERATALVTSTPPPESRAASPEKRRTDAPVASSVPPSPAEAPAAAPERPGTVVDRGRTIEVSTAGGRRVFRCEGGSLIVNGSGNDVLAWGECERIEVNGYGNRVRVEGVRALEVNGIDQDVAWVRGGGEERPSIASHGMGNRVRQVALDELD